MLDAVCTYVAVGICLAQREAVRRPDEVGGPDDGAAGALALGEAAANALGIGRAEEGQEEGQDGGKEHSGVHLNRCPLLRYIVATAN